MSIVGTMEITNRVIDDESIYSITVMSPFGEIRWKLMWSLT